MQANAECAKALSCLTGLTLLYLAKSAFDDACMSHISSLRNLCHFSLNYTQVSDGGELLEHATSEILLVHCNIHISMLEYTE